MVGASISIIIRYRAIHCSIISVSGFIIGISIEGPLAYQTIGRHIRRNILCKRNYCEKQQQQGDIHFFHMFYLWILLCPWAEVMIKNESAWDPSHSALEVLVYPCNGTNQSPRLAWAFRFITRCIFKLPVFQGTK